MANLLKSLKISSDQINVRVLKLPSTEAHSILKSLNTNPNLSFIFKPSLNHSFSVYPKDNLLKEYFRTSFPVQYKTITHNTNINEYITDIISNPQNTFNPYIIFLLGIGKSYTGYFDKNNTMNYWIETSRIIQCKNSIKLKYPKRNPVFITDANLTRFYKEVMYKSHKWNYLLHKKYENEFDINNINIAWMAEGKIWNNFWNYHENISEKENENENIMPFDLMHSNLIRIGEYGMGYPKRSDLTRYSHELSDFYFYIDNDLIFDKYFPEYILDLMSDTNICWDPLTPDINEMRNRQGKRISKWSKELNNDNKIKEWDPWKYEQLRQEKKMEKKMVKMEKEKEKKRESQKFKYDKQSQKWDDLDKILNTSNTARV